VTSEMTPKNIFFLITLIVIIASAVYGLAVLPTPYERCLDTAEQRRLECASSGLDQVDCSRISEIEKKSRCHKPAGHHSRTDIT
jgi:hypothetical protein